MQGLEDDILESSLGGWADTAATYCPGRPLQIVLKPMTKHRESVEKNALYMGLILKRNFCLDVNGGFDTS